MFVKNRVLEIKRQGDIKFEFIPTNDNPADIATRGTSTIKLIENRLWWHGPVWLNCAEESWKTFSCAEDEHVLRNYQSEVNKVKDSSSHLSGCADTMNITEYTPYGIHSERFSSFLRMIRTTAWITRFINRLRKTTTESRKELTSAELQNAKMLWCQEIQKKHYSDVLQAISSRKKNNFQRQLGLFADDDGILRCRGRFENTELSEGAKFPILLPRGERFTELLIQHIHCKQLHSGVSQTLSQIRYNNWIPHGRAAVRQVLV